jgi:hypothetical protein
MSPHETLFLEGTNSLDIKYIANNSFVQFQIWDFPGDYDFKGASLGSRGGARWHRTDHGGWMSNGPMDACMHGQTTWCTAGNS